jgi:hypothetical protein
MKSIRYKIKSEEDYIWERIRNEVYRGITDVAYNRCYVTIDNQSDILYEIIDQVYRQNRRRS